MTSTTSDSQADASGAVPKQLGYLSNLKLADGNEIPMVSAVRMAEIGRT